MDIPDSVGDIFELDLLEDYRGVESKAEVLFVSEYEERNILELIFSEKGLKLLSAFFNSGFI